MPNLDKFTTAYIVAALWSSTDNTTDQGGEPLDANYSADDIAPDTLARIIADCEAFQAANGHLFTDENCNYHGCSVEEYAGHDFWLTRNGHGCGFWDGRWVKPVGEQLTKSAESFGGFDLYIGDDGKVWA